MLRVDDRLSLPGLLSRHRASITAVTMRTRGIGTAAEVAVCPTTTLPVYPSESTSVAKGADQRPVVCCPVRLDHSLFGSCCRNLGPAEQFRNLRTEAAMSLHVCIWMIGLCIKLPFRLQYISIVFPWPYRR
jgi:hypothetical protein